jgi:hypothetical protein
MTLTTTKTRDRRAQASAEFIISIGIMLVVFLALSGIITQQYDRYQLQRVDEAARAIIQTFTLHLTAVHVAGDGAKATITLPASIDTPNDYNITVFPDARIARIDYNNPGWFTTKDTALPTSAITGRTSGINSTVTLRNENGVIIIG